MDCPVTPRIERAAEQTVRGVVAEIPPTRRLKLEPLEDRVAPIIMANTEGDFHFKGTIPGSNMRGLLNGPLNG